MTGTTIILIIFGIFAAVVGGTIVVFFGRIVWAMRNPQAFKAFQEREIAAESKRRQNYVKSENERVRLGKPSWAGRFFGAVFTLVGAAVLAYSGWQIYDLARGQFWTETTCTILKSDFSSSSAGRSATEFRPEVEYSYSFDGQSYTGKRLALASETYLSSTDAQNAIKNYRRGATAVCYVNPKNPSESVLNRSLTQFPLYQNGAALIICFGLGFGLLYVSRRRMPQNLIKGEISQ